jgi:ADP-heptose:LPS heptosyltransferase
MKKIIIVDNKEGLIGDFLGTIPAMQELAKDNLVIVKIHPEARGLFSLIRDLNIEDYGHFIETQPNEYITLSSAEAFQIASRKGYYMSQAYMEQAGLEVPIIPPKANLSYRMEEVPIEYIISPFARSLPEQQKWPQEKWQLLVDSLPNNKFLLIGNSKFDNKDFIKGSNVSSVFDLPFYILCNIFKKSKALISVVTGTSHLAFHLEVKNILLTNQNMTWGNNPDAIKITKYIPDITVEDIIEKL